MINDPVVHARIQRIHAETRKSRDRAALRAATWIGWIRTADLGRGLRLSI